MTKDKKMNLNATKDKSLHSMVTNTMDEMNQNKTASLLQNKGQENNIESTTVEIKMDYKRAYELAMFTIVELQEAMENMVSDQRQVHETFATKFEELQNKVKVLCVDFDFQ